MNDERMPSPEVYEEELKFIPYGKTLSKVVELVCSLVPQNGSLIDFMCGTGYLLGEIHKQRADLSLTGIDIDPRYVEFARANYPGIGFKQEDILDVRSPNEVDAFTCTGALHHIPWKMQDRATKIMANSIYGKGFGIIADCYIGIYYDEKQRKLAAAELGYEYLIETIRNGCSDEVAAVTADILKNDIMGIEFKTSLPRRLQIFNNHFGKETTYKIWPDGNQDYGDYVTVLRNPAREN